jgi:hypothetical protein
MVGKIFAVVVILVTLITAYCVITHVWWMPVDISVHGPKIDHQIEETVVVAGLLFIAGQIVLASTSRPRKPDGSRSYARNCAGSGTTT